MIEGISRIDRESAQEFMELAERSRQLKWQYQGIVEMLGKGSAELTNAEFQAKLNHIMEIGGDPLLREYIQVEEGSFIYQWDRISDTMKKASLSDRQLDLMVRILIEMGYEKQWKDLYREFVQVSNQSVKNHEFGINPNLELLLHCYDQTTANNHAMRAAYEELARMVASQRRISVTVVLDQKAYEYERIIEWIQPDYQMSDEEIAAAKKILSAYWGKGTDLEHLSPDRFNSLRKAAKELSVPEFEEYQLHLLLSYKCNPWDSFWLKMADNVKIFSVLSDLSIEHDLNQYGKEYLDALQYKNAATIAGSQHPWQSKAGGISGGVVNILMAMRAAKGIDQLQGIFGGATTQGVVNPVLPGVTKVLSGFSLKELGIASLIDAGLYTLLLAVEDWKEGKSVREIAKNVRLNTFQSVGFNAAGMVAVDLAKIAASYVKDWAKPHLHDWLKWLGRNGDDVAKAADDVVEGPKSLPQGISQESFEQGSKLIRDTVGDISDDIVVQGSRANGTAKPTSDIDIAIRVTPEQFDELIQKSFNSPNPGSAKERTMLHAIETGKIQAGEAGLRNLRKQLEQVFGMEVDISIIEIGGPFDNPPFISVN